MGEYPLLRLEFALSISLSLDQYVIFICKGNAIAILRHCEEFLIFVSHSRNKNGLFCIDGSSIVLKKKILLMFVGI